MKYYNFVLVRHGQSCNNARMHDKDPMLTPLVDDASEYNGKVITDNLNSKHRINHINFVMCSPLLRSMETAYQMTKNWVGRPAKIYVVPHLREISFRHNSADEYYANIDSEVERINNNNGFSMLSVEEQLFKLKTISNIDTDLFDFTYLKDDSGNINNDLRNSIGDISNFIRWFKQKVTLEPCNVFAVTHSGVLYEAMYSVGIREVISMYNNTGIIVKDNINDKRNITIISRQNIYKDRYKDEKKDSHYNYEKCNICPSPKCGCTEKFNQCTQLTRKRFEKIN